jgi:hypothetical protein
LVKRKTILKYRKVHRYLGIFIGIQFIMWTVSGLYFSWTNLDEIHGDHFKKHRPEAIGFNSLTLPGNLIQDMEVKSLSLKEIAGQPYYLVNNEVLINAETGIEKPEISKEEALSIAERHMAEGLEVTGIERLEETGKHHEYRSGSLPAYVISYKTPENLKAYISIKEASFKSVRHRDWRWFDFLWMTHTMDYEGRDDFNNTILRIFSLLGLITVTSGFVLWYITSPSVYRIKEYITQK